MNKFQTLGRTKTINGTIINPEGTGLKYILSINNMQGTADQNPLMPILEKKWKNVKTESKIWFANRTGAYKLGAINTTAVQSDVWIIHMLCQDTAFNVDKKALEQCIKHTVASAKYEKATIHVSSLLTEKMKCLENLLSEYAVQQGVNVFFYNEI
jgi:hypothetical protein